MKFNSKYAYIFSALFVLAILIASASAAGNLVSNDFGNLGFAIDIPSGSDFNNEATTNITAGDVAMNMSVFENQGTNANDVSSIIYLKDQSSKQNIIDDAINDLRKNGNILEENDKYFIVETKNSNNFFNFDIGNSFNDAFSFFNGFFSSKSDIGVSTQDADVKVSNEGINIVDADNTSVKLSDKGFYVSEGNGDNVSISANGLKVSTADDNSTGADVNTNVNMDGHLASNIANGDYALCIKDSNNGQVIIITGNNLDVMKSMAKTASFEA